MSTCIVNSLPIVAENFRWPDRGADGSPRFIGAVFPSRPVGPVWLRLVRLRAGRGHDMSGNKARHVSAARLGQRTAP